MIKTLTFGAFTVAQGLSGSLLVGGAIALVGTAIHTLAYFFHEKLREKMRPRRNDPGVPVPA